MSKDFLVLRGNRVVYTPGHYDLEGARSVAEIERKQHPLSEVKIVRIIDTIGPIRGGER